MKVAPTIAALIAVLMCLASTVHGWDACHCPDDCVLDLQFWLGHTDQWPDDLASETFPCGPTFLEVLTTKVANCQQTAWLALAKEYIVFRLNWASFLCIRILTPAQQLMKDTAERLLSGSTCSIDPADVRLAYNTAAKLALFNDGLFENGPQSCDNQCNGCPPQCGCTHTQGWYKNHFDEWKDFLPLPSVCGFTTADDWLALLNTPPAGSHWIALAHQFITAYLNINFQGACADALTTHYLEEALMLLEDHCPPARIPAHEASTLTQALDEFNMSDECP
jgi:hypothetical protein